MINLSYKPKDENERREILNTLIHSYELLEEKLNKNLLREKEIKEG